MEDQSRKYLRSFLGVCCRQEVITEDQRNCTLKAFLDSRTLRMCSIASTICLEYRSGGLREPSPEYTLLVARQVVGAFDQMAQGVLQGEQEHFICLVQLWIFVHSVKSTFSSGSMFSRIARRNAQLKEALSAMQSDYEIDGPPGTLLNFLVAFVDGVPTS